MKAERNVLDLKLAAGRCCSFDDDQHDDGTQQIQGLIVTRGMNRTQLVKPEFFETLVEMHTVKGIHQKTIGCGYQ